MYKEVEGDLLDLFEKDEFDVIMHGCNCLSTMGAGIAKQIALRYPPVYQRDQNSKLFPGQKLGHYSVCNTQYGIVVNVYTQYNLGPNFNKTAFRLGLQKISVLFDKETKIGLPLIGCGIGGGNWEEVKAIIVEELSDFDVTVVMYKPKKRKK